MHASYVLGYDSDDEEDNDTKSTRRIRGKKYVSVPKDDSFDQPVHRVNGANGHHENNQQKPESIDYYLKKTRRGSSCVDSDSEYGSDKESPSKTSYVKEKNPGGISYILYSMDGYLCTFLGLTRLISHCSPTKCISTSKTENELETVVES